MLFIIVWYLFIATNIQVCQNEYNSTQSIYLRSKGLSFEPHAKYCREKKTQIFKFYKFTQKIKFDSEICHTNVNQHNHKTLY